MDFSVATAILTHSKNASPKPVEAARKVEPMMKRSKIFEGDKNWLVAIYPPHTEWEFEIIAPHPDNFDAKDFLETIDRIFGTVEDPTLE